jgi:hypothetical protein
MVFLNFISGMKKSFKRSDEDSLRGLGFMRVDSSKQGKSEKSDKRKTPDTSAPQTG